MALPLRYNFRGLLRRKTRTAMTALGIGLAVLVSVLMLALSTGLMNSISATGHPLNVLGSRPSRKGVLPTAIKRDSLSLRTVRSFLRTIPESLHLNPSLSDCESVLQREAKRGLER
jgi:hypothetical protein